MKKLKTTIIWNDKIRKVNKIPVRFQNMHGTEVAVFDRNDLVKFIKDIKMEKNAEIIEISEFGINEVNVTIKYEGKTYCGCLSELENNENR